MTEHDFDFFKYTHKLVPREENNDSGIHGHEGSASPDSRCNARIVWNWQGNRGTIAIITSFEHFICNSHSVRCHSSHDVSHSCHGNSIIDITHNKVYCCDGIILPATSLATGLLLVSLVTFVYVRMWYVDGGAHTFLIKPLHTTILQAREPQ